MSFLKLTPQSPNCQISYRVLCLDGRTIWVEKSARAFFDQDGRMLRMIGVITGITARKQAEETVREVNADIAGSLRPPMKEYGFSIRSSILSL